MNSNAPDTLGIDKVYREAPFPVILVMPIGAAMPTVVAIRVYYNGILQPGISVPVVTEGLQIKWTFTVAQLRDMEKKKAFFDVQFDGVVVAGDPITPSLTSGIPTTDPKIVNIGGFGSVRIVFDSNFAAIQLETNRAEAAADRAEATEQRIKDNNAQARKYQDSWNIATNVPNLAGLTLNNTTDKGKFWKVAYNGAGTTSLTGTSINAVAGDEFTWNGTVWKYDPFVLADNSITAPKLAPDVRYGVVGNYDDSNLSPSTYRPFIGNDAVKRYPIMVNGDGRVKGRFDIDLRDVPQNSPLVGKTIRWVGDSITWQYNSDVDDVKRSYADQICTMLGAKCDNQAISGSNVTFIPKGQGDPSPINTTGIPGMSATYAELIAEGLSHPFSYQSTCLGAVCDVLVIAHGYNDHPYLMPGYPINRLGNIGSTDKGTLYGAYNTMLDAILTANWNLPIVLVTTPNAYSYGTTANTAALQMTRQVQLDIAAKYKLRVLDLMANMGVNLKNVAPGKKTSDHLHPSRSLNDEMAKFGYKFFLDNF